MKRVEIVNYVRENGWLDQLNIFFKNKYGVTFEHVAHDQEVLTYNFWSNNDGISYQGKAFLKESKVILQETSLCETNPHIDLGLIVHEFSHVAQYITGLYEELKPSTLTRIWNCNCFRSKDHKHNFYWNNPVEVDARKSVAEFSAQFGYEDLAGGEINA